MHLLSILFLSLQVLILPLLSFKTKEIIDEDIEMPSRAALYTQSIIMLSVLGLLAALVDWKEHLDIQWFGVISFNTVLIALGLYVVSMVVNIIHFKYFSTKEDKEENFILPETKKDYGLWFLLCITAAWSEELVYRGVLTGLITKLGMMPLLAAILSAVCFAFSHSAQGFIAIPVTFVFALGFQYLYKSSGMLIVPVVVHFAYNISIEWVKRKIDTTPINQNKE